MEIEEARHIILYAKGHYKRGDMMEDLQKIIVHITGLEKRFVYPHVIYDIVAKIFNKYVSVQDKNNFISALFSYDIFEGQPTQITTEKAITYLLSTLACLKTRASDGSIRLDLGEPDPNILPLRAGPCVWDFKSVKCGYAGEATTCKKTSYQCRAYGNSARFGGYLER